MSSGGAAFHLMLSSCRTTKASQHAAWLFGLNEKNLQLTLGKVTIPALANSSPLAASVLMNYHTVESSAEDFTSSIKIFKNAELPAGSLPGKKFKFSKQK